LELAQIEVSPEAQLLGLREVHWPGRFQRIGERFILDGAHNPAAAARLTQTWAENYGSEKAIVLIGVLKDKDVRAVCAALSPIAQRWVAVPVKNDRSTSALELASLLGELNPEVECSVAPDLASALQLFKNDPHRVLITGSLFLVGEALAAFGQSDLPIQRSSQ
jgi:dihydrofolate synthase / folylpolyglutamate synthase